MKAWPCALAIGALALAAPLVAGCRPEVCYLRVCSGGDCRCAISSCGAGAAFDPRVKRCRCLVGNVAIAGQCVPWRDANAYCGRGHHWENGGCAADRCKPGDELDLSTGLCIPHAQVNEVATKMGVTIGKGEKLGCPEGQKLTIDGSVAACVPMAQTCAPDEQWNGESCAKVAQECATGSTWDAAAGRCVEYVKPSVGAEETKVDVAQWVQSNYGADGGPGAPAFCAAFSKKPWSFGVVEGQQAVLRISVNVTFPEADIARGAVQTSTVFDLRRIPVPAKGAGEIDAAARRLVAPLVQGGGRANVEAASTTVKCAIINAAKPQPIPATGGI